MKNLFLSFITLIVFSFGANATSTNENLHAVLKVNTVSNIKTDIDATNISVKFNSLDEFEKYNPESLKAFLLCDVTVTVSVGFGSTYSSATFTAKNFDCNQIAIVIKQLKAKALAALR